MVTVDVDGGSQQAEL